MSKENNLKYLCMLPFLLAFLFLMSCNSTEPEVSDEFSLEIKLTNTAGTPLEGYRLAIFQKDLNAWNPGIAKKSSTCIRFDTQNNYRVEIVITDYFNNQIRTLSDQLCSAGSNFLHWDGRNDAGNVIRDGIYKIKARYYDLDDNLIFSDMFLAYQLGEFDASLAPYITDLNGEVYSTDITPFPILYCLESICILDSNGEYLSDQIFSATSDSMEIVIVAPDKTSRSHYFRINKGRNILNLNWDTLLEDTEEAQILCVPSLPLNSAEPHITHKQFTNKLYGCFPNPFN